MNPVNYPEVRVDSIENTGSLTIRFTNKMDFPANLAQTINQQHAHARSRKHKANKRMLNESSSDEKSFVEILEIDGDTELIGNNLLSWSVISVSSTKMKIGIDFERPLFVSNGYSPDFITV